MDRSRIQRERLAALLTVGAVLTILTGLAIGIFVSPFGYIAVVVGLLDFVWIALIRSGRAGPGTGDPAPVEVAAPAEIENPYARED